MWLKKFPPSCGCCGLKYIHACGSQACGFAEVFIHEWCLVCHVSLTPLSLQYDSVTVAENIPIGTVILEIQATDGDEPDTGSSLILYQVKEGDPNNTFIIETDSETNRGFVKINKVNRWNLFFSFNVTYLSYPVTALVMICGEAVDWWWVGTP